MLAQKDTKIEELQLIIAQKDNKTEELQQSLAAVSAEVIELRSKYKELERTSGSAPKQQKTTETHPYVVIGKQRTEIMQLREIAAKANAETAAIKLKAEVRERE